MAEEKLPIRITGQRSGDVDPETMASVEEFLKKNTAKPVPTASTQRKEVFDTTQENDEDLTNDVSKYLKNQEKLNKSIKTPSTGEFNDIQNKLFSEGSDSLAKIHDELTAGSSPYLENIHGHIANILTHAGRLLLAGQDEHFRGNITGGRRASSADQLATRSAPQVRPEDVAGGNIGSQLYDTVRSFTDSKGNVKTDTPLAPLQASIDAVNKHLGSSQLASARDFEGMGSRDYMVHATSLINGVGRAISEIAKSNLDPESADSTRRAGRAPVTPDKINNRLNKVLDKVNKSSLHYLNRDDTQVDSQSGEEGTPSNFGSLFGVDRELKKNNNIAKSLNIQSEIEKQRGFVGGLYKQLFSPTGFYGKLIAKREASRGHELPVESLPPVSTAISPNSTDYIPKNPEPGSPYYTAPATAPKPTTPAKVKAFKPNTRPWMEGVSEPTDQELRLAMGRGNEVRAPREGELVNYEGRQTGSVDLIPAVRQMHAQGRHSSEFTLPSGRLSPTGRALEVLENYKELASRPALSQEEAVKAADEKTKAAQQEAVDSANSATAAAAEAFAKKPKKATPEEQASAVLEAREADRQGVASRVASLKDAIGSHPLAETWKSKLYEALDKSNGYGSGVDVDGEEDPTNLVSNVYNHAGVIKSAHRIIDAVQNSMERSGISTRQQPTAARDKRVNQGIVPTREELEQAANVGKPVMPAAPGLFDEKVDPTWGGRVDPSMGVTARPLGTQGVTYTDASGEKRVRRNRTGQILNPSAEGFHAPTLTGVNASVSRIRRARNLYETAVSARKQREYDDEAARRAGVSVLQLPDIGAKPDTRTLEERMGEQLMNQSNRDRSRAPQVTFTEPTAPEPTPIKENVDEAVMGENMVRTANPTEMAKPLYSDEEIEDLKQNRADTSVSSGSSAAAFTPRARKK